LSIQQGQHHTKPAAHDALAHGIGSLRALLDGAEPFAKLAILCPKLLEIRLR
jgi:hypothetical protein